MLKIANVTFDCENPTRVAEFWSTALGYKVEHVSDDVSMASHPEGIRPNLLFLKVPEPRSAKNRMHMDVEADDREAEIERLIGLGATRGDTHTVAEWALTWTVMRDPEGNELCVAQTAGN
jgi:hypothetical protein